MKRALFVGIFLLAFASACMAHSICEPGAPDHHEPVMLTGEPSPGMSLGVTEAPHMSAKPYTLSPELSRAYHARFGDVDYVLALSPSSPAPGFSCEPEGAQMMDVSVDIVMTTDADFVSPEGLRVGDTLERALGASGPGEPVFMGAGECLKLSSGWTACFWYMDLQVDPDGVSRPSSSASIKWFWRQDRETLSADGNTKTSP